MFLRCRNNFNIELSIPGQPAPNIFFLIFTYLNIYLFIYFWLCWVFVSVRGLSLVAASGGHSSSRCTGLSLSQPLLLRSTGSRRAGSVVVAHGPSCSAACGIFPDQGLNPCPLHRQADSQPLRHQGSPLQIFCCTELGRGGAIPSGHVLPHPTASGPEPLHAFPPSFPQLPVLKDLGDRRASLSTSKAAGQRRIQEPRTPTPLLFFHYIFLEVRIR